MSLIDAFMFFDEDLMLDIRLNTLNSVVDKFIIAEGTRDHAGNEKKLNFDINKYKKFKNKIKYLVVEDIPKEISSLFWQKLREIKNKIKVSIDSAKLSSLIKEGFAVAIVGKPNVGKSSLINTLTKLIHLS